MRLLLNHTEYTRVSSAPTAYTGCLSLEDARSRQPAQLTKITIQALNAACFTNATVIAYNASLPQRETFISYELISQNGKALSLSDVRALHQQVCREIEQFLSGPNVAIVEVLPAVTSRA